jgi:hypothetical protein
VNQSKTIPLRSVNGELLDLKEGVLLSAEGAPIQQKDRVAPPKFSMIHIKGPWALLIALPLGLLMSAVVVVVGLFTGVLVVGLRCLGVKKASRY